MRRLRRLGREGNLGEIIEIVILSIVTFILGRQHIFRRWVGSTRQGALFDVMRGPETACFGLKKGRLGIKLFSSFIPISKKIKRCFKKLLVTMANNNRQQPAANAKPTYKQQLDQAAEGHSASSLEMAASVKDTIIEKGMCACFPWRFTLYD